MKNNKTGNSVKKNSKVLENAAITIQKYARGKKNRNKVTQMTKNKNFTIEKAVSAGFNRRYVKEYANAHGYIPSIKELNNSLNSNFARNFKKHFGYENLKLNKNVLSLMKSLGLI